MIHLFLCFLYVCVSVLLYLPSVFAEIGPVTITTDPKKFQDELRELYVQVSSKVT